MLGPVLEVTIGGLLTGVLYSLVALGFVLIFKASGVFNFAQGAMVLFAALTLAQLTQAKDVPAVSMVGAGATTISYTDLMSSDLVVLFGSDVANAQPVVMKYLYLARREGTKVVVVNPYREPGLERYWVPSNAGSALFGTDLADYWFPVAQGGDVAFLYGTLKALLERGAVDRDFIAAPPRALRPSSRRWPNSRGRI